MGAQQSKERSRSGRSRKQAGGRRLSSVDGWLRRSKSPDAQAELSEGSSRTPRPVPESSPVQQSIVNKSQEVPPLSAAEVVHPPADNRSAGSAPDAQARPSGSSIAMEHICTARQTNQYLDTITRLAASLLDCTASVVTIFNKAGGTIYSAYGLTGDDSHLDLGPSGEHPDVARGAGCCCWVLLQLHKRMLVMEDCSTDLRVRGQSLSLGDRPLKFYAGAPLVASNGHTLGVLCVFDTSCHTFPAARYTLLSHLAEFATNELEGPSLLAGAQRVSVRLDPSGQKSLGLRAWLLRGRSAESPQNPSVRITVADKDAGAKPPGSPREPDSSRGPRCSLDIVDRAQIPVLPDETRALSPHGVALLRSPELLHTGIMLCDPNQQTWPVQYVSSTWVSLTGVSGERAMRAGLWGLFCEQGATVEGSEAHAASLMMPCRYSFRMKEQQEHTPAYFCVLVCKERERKSFPSSTGTPSAVPRLSPPLSRQASSASDVPLPGINTDVFEDTELGPLLGKGGNGRVYYGQWKGRQVAVKVLENFIPLQDALKMVMESPAEVLVAIDAQHPNIICTHHHGARLVKGYQGQSSDSPMSTYTSSMWAQTKTEACVIVERWLIMEYCPGGSLQDAVEKGLFHSSTAERGSQPDFNLILSMATDIASGVHFLHQRGFLHGDLAPGNVLLIPAADRACKWIGKVSDFGMSRAMEGGSSFHTKTFGTVTHMPPELLMEGKLSRATDTFAFGVLLWSLCTGQRPWQGLQSTQVMIKVAIMKQQLQCPEGTPPDIKALVDQCLEREHKSRPAFDVILQQLSVISSRLGQEQPLTEEAPTGGAPSEAVAVATPQP
ncbi:hypothetical protein WJX73_002782 [Symbiochloris irregularis]|uniref:Protein kinase domain-containing protein n=1 Tax=Symbiochloris irregularis TaxID=706552 RepID=A0AAW1P227_9CHLO